MEASQLDSTNIQGNLAGFNKDHQRFVLLRFADKPTAQAFLGYLADDIATCEEVLAFNVLFKQVNQRRNGRERGTVESTWLNLGLTASGLRLLEAEGFDALPEDFKAGMRARAGTIGDEGANEPGRWIAPFTEAEAPIHAVALIAADDPDDLEEEFTHLGEVMTEHQVQRIGEPINGDARPGDQAGHEHFGFKDGISQPGIAGLTDSSHKGTDAIAAGEFICGYPGEGDPPPPPQPPADGYNPTPAPPVLQGLPAWTKDGSFLVFRRLQQNVKGFRDEVAEQAGAEGISPELFGAKLIGRYASGAPLEHTPDEPADLDPETADPSVADPSLLGDEKINDFDYDGDPDGILVPRAAHIRKVNPRSGNPQGKADSNGHRILRRGITYGKEFAENENPYPQEGQVPPEQDRGLLFVCYQSSIARGFEFVQSQWANQANFPKNEDGEDPIIAQKDEPRPFTLPRKEGDPLHLSFKQWVRTTGGEYFFSPSIAAIKTLAGQA